MTTPATNTVVAVVGASSFSGTYILLHLESYAPNIRLVALDSNPLRYPISRASAHRLFDQNSFYTTELITLEDAPRLLELEGVDTLIHVGSHHPAATGPAHASGYSGYYPLRANLDPAFAAISPDNYKPFLAKVSNWIDASAAAGVRQFIYLSDYRVYGFRPGNALPLTERSSPNPAPAHRQIWEYEPSETAGRNMGITIFRTGMTVSAEGASPMARALFPPGRPPQPRWDTPLQFLHHYDLARAIQAAIDHRVTGTYNLVGDGTIPQKEVARMSQPAPDAPRSRAYRPYRSGPGRQPASARASSDDVGDPGRHAAILSATKFKQAAHFRYRYTSMQAARAFCHSVIQEPEHYDD